MVLKQFLAHILKEKNAQKSIEKKNKNKINIPSEFRFDIAVSATESSLKLGFIGRPLLVTSEEKKRERE